MTKDKAALLKQLRLALNDLEDREHALHYIVSKGIYDTSIPEARVKWEQDRITLLLRELTDDAESKLSILMKAIGEAAATAGIIAKDHQSLSGPECLMLLDDLAHIAGSTPVAEWVCGEG